VQEAGNGTLAPFGRPQVSEQSCNRQFFEVRSRARAPGSRPSTSLGYTEAEIQAGRVDPVGYTKCVSAFEGTAALPSHFDRPQAPSQQSRRTLPFASNVDLLGDFDGVIDLDAEIADGALDLGVSEQELHRSQISRPPVDQHRLRATLMPISA
jgi:hypothetical protein